MSNKKRKTSTKELDSRSTKQVFLEMAAKSSQKTDNKSARQPVVALVLP